LDILESIPNGIYWAVMSRCYNGTFQIGNLPMHAPDQLQLHQLMAEPSTPPWSHRGIPKELYGFFVI